MPTEHPKRASGMRQRRYSAVQGGGSPAGAAAQRTAGRRVKLQETVFCPFLRFAAPVRFWRSGPADIWSRCCFTNGIALSTGKAP
eukprot:5027045-Alexandrium_andersonii.AAC.1